MARFTKSVNINKGNFNHSEFDQNIDIFFETTLHNKYSISCTENSKPELLKIRKSSRTKILHLVTCNLENLFNKNQLVQAITITKQLTDTPVV